MSPANVCAATDAADFLDGERDAAPPESGPFNYRDELFEAFEKLVHDRRAVRLFDRSVTEVPDQVFERAVSLALLAPSSSNLQPWQFVRVKNPDLKAQMIPLCLNFPSAVSAAEFVVCAGRVDRWRRHTKDIIEIMKQRNITLPPP